MTLVLILFAVWLAIEAAGWLAVWPMKRRARLARKRVEEARRRADYAEARMQEFVL